LNCDDCVRLLERYLDRELSDQDVAEVKRHMKLCGSCENRFHFHAELKRLVRVSCCRGEAPESLRARLREILPTRANS